MSAPADAVTFAAGERVPDWLLSVEPLAPSQVRAEITFVEAVVVVTTDKAHFVQPLKPTQFVIRFFFEPGTAQIIAADLPVIIATQWLTFPPSMKAAP